MLQPIACPRVTGGPAHRESPVALFLVTTDHSTNASAHRVSSRPRRLPSETSRDEFRAYSSPCDTRRVAEPPFALRPARLADARSRLPARSRSRHGRGALHSSSKSAVPLAAVVCRKQSAPVRTEKHRTCYRFAYGREVSDTYADPGNM